MQRHHPLKLGTASEMQEMRLKKAEAKEEKEENSGVKALLLLASKSHWIFQPHKNR